MPIPTEPIGSIPRSRELLTAMGDHAAGRITDAQLEAAQHEALKDSIARLEETGSPVLTDGEQRSRALRPIRWRDYTSSRSMG